MRPWDETWTVGTGDAVYPGDGRACVLRESGDAFAFVWFAAPGKDPRTDARMEARMRLSAAAPAMARLLCRLERGVVQDETGCVACGEFADGDVSEHTANCALDAALSQAGINPEERERVRGGK